jgi:molybdopterin/thiamine biosynthesis adenylyltransferase
MEDYDTKKMWAQRYSRQILVPQFNGVEGQRNVSKSSVLIVGAGGIGSTVIMYLAGAGVGTIGIMDFDKVEESNLHRQIIHDTEGGRNITLKAESARARVHALNPHIRCTVIIDRVHIDNAVKVIGDFDVVVDATDNSSARYALNSACNFLKKPLVSGSAGRSLKQCYLESSSFKYVAMFCSWHGRSADGVSLLRLGHSLLPVHLPQPSPGRGL